MKSEDLKCGDCAFFGASLNNGSGVHNCEGASTRPFVRADDPACPSYVVDASLLGAITRNRRARENLRRQLFIHPLPADNKQRKWLRENFPHRFLNSLGIEPYAK